MRNGGNGTQDVHTVSGSMTNIHKAGGGLNTPPLWILNRGHIHTGVHNIPGPRLNTLPPTLTPSSPIFYFLSGFIASWPHPFVLFPKIILLAHHNSPHICLLPLSLNCVLHGSAATTEKYFSSSWMLLFVLRSKCLFLCLSDLFTV